jgi:hypothetical protein
LNGQNIPFVSHVKYLDVIFDKIPALTETWMDNDETVPAEGYKCTTPFKRQYVRAGVVAIYEKNNDTTIATPHVLMKLDK